MNIYLKILICNNNQLSILPKLNKNLKILICNNNKLIYLPDLNENIIDFYYNNNPIYEIIKYDNLLIIKQNIKIVNNFRYLYYLLKFKKKFRYFLWLKVRESKIKKIYDSKHLNNLDEYLHNIK